MTKIASGYWHVADSQSGYTAVNLETLSQLDLERLYPRYGLPNDMLVHLNVWNRRVRDYPSRPIYGVGEKSGIRSMRSCRGSLAPVKGFCWRLKEKYVIRDFHPLVSLYASGSSFLSPASLWGSWRPALYCRKRHPGGHGRARRDPSHHGGTAHVVRHVVRHGGQQGFPVRIP